MWQDINRRNQVFSRYEKLFGKRILKLDFGGFLLGKTNGIFEKFFRWTGVFSALLGINEIQETTSHTSDEGNSFLQEVAQGEIVNGRVFKRGGGIFHGWFSSFSPKEHLCIMP